MRFHASAVMPAAASLLIPAHRPCRVTAMAVPFASALIRSFALKIRRGVFHLRLPAQRHTNRASLGCGSTSVIVVVEPTSDCMAATRSR
ncbi:hypothetical protein PF001_g4207 [Phytophthora fragariae]|uniref:Uncharacterized protein n=1 Tax=Phytophthora fragariae TaxID=53985 RepID=A0A6A4EIA6_9STRA|nr:hypothetical protein PF009_g5313 [Phytophthora fragariae]KAE8990171.1 hypothetical protein PF011_g18460 [Phytophthora fragariae]KAE9151587.1 hypothetical protein PF006_g4129 [Phytophthora fragariae]KAE9246058.1 hypothetical protein PF004_g4965 [Phytophthora fragariae]KAE9322841.1 hypothetical protein PF001_g4207 [Phytophthora fragariae]